MRIKLLIQCIFMLSLYILPIDTIADAEELFEKANNAYKEERYGDAVILYEDILDEAYSSADVHYNLGNAYFRMENLAYAILHYERALKLDPSSEDIQQNLAIANSRTIDRIEPLPKFFLYNWIDNTVFTHSSGFWSWMGIVLLWMSLALAALFIFGSSPQLRKLGLFSGIFVFLLSILAIIAAWQTNHHENLRTEAIVMSPTAYIRSEPTDNSQELFILHEGTKADIIGLEDGFFQIRLADGNRGWISQSEMERI